MSSIRKNIAYQALYEILVLILPFFTSPYISRIFGAEYLGVFSYTYSIAYYFQIFGMLGIKFHGNRAIARSRDNREELNRVYSEILSLHIISCAISALVYILYCFIFAEYRTYAMIQGLLVLSALFDVSWLFFGLERFKETVTRNSLIKLASVAAIFLFIRSQEDFWVYVVIMAGSQLVSQMILFGMARKYVRFSFVPLSSLGKHVKPLVVLFVPVLALSLFKFMDKIMLGSMGSKTELGYYENAERVLNIPLSVIFSFGSVMLPRMSNLMANNAPESVDKYTGLSITYMTGLSYPMAFGLAGIAAVFAPVFWGNGFVASGTIIAVLAISIPFSTVANIIRNQDLIPRGKDDLYSWAIVAGAVVNLILNYFLIPRLQAVGVSIATVASEMLVCFVELWYVRQKGNYFKSIAKSLIFFVPALMMYMVIRYMGGAMGVHLYTLAAQVILGVLVFAALGLMTVVVCKDEICMNVIYRAFKKNRT